MRIVRFSAEHKAVWDGFVVTSKNGSFLFYRDYISYHEDRFQDHSLLFYDDKEGLIALFPANQQGQNLYSHGGLTYGGFVSDERMKISKMLTCFLALFAYAKNAGLKEIYYKCIPHIYHSIPSQEDLYVLHLAQTTCISRNVIMAIDTSHILEFQTRRLRQIKTALKNKVFVQESKDIETYWGILNTLLKSVHNTQPVHSLVEIKRLQALFPENVRLFASYYEEEMIAGVLVYESSQVARTQYIASSPKGRDLGALDLIFNEMIHNYYHHKTYIEFGTSERANTRNYVNTGLIDQKEGFGARAIIQDQYLIQLDNVSIEALEEAYS